MIEYFLSPSVWVFFIPVYMSICFVAFVHCLRVCVYSLSPSICLFVLSHMLIVSVRPRERALRCASLRLLSSTSQYGSFAGLLTASLLSRWGIFHRFFAWPHYPLSHLHIKQLHWPGLNTMSCVFLVKNFERLEYRRIIGILVFSYKNVKNLVYIDSRHLFRFKTMNLGYVS